jgi:hypothetical protein
MLIPFPWRKKPLAPYDLSRAHLRNIILATLQCRHVGINFSISPYYLPLLAQRIAAEAPDFATPRAMIDWLVPRLEREQFSLWEDAMDGSTEASVA